MTKKAEREELIRQLEDALRRGQGLSIVLSLFKAEKLDMLDISTYYAYLFETHSNDAKKELISSLKRGLLGD